MVQGVIRRLVGRLKRLSELLGGSINNMAKKLSRSKAKKILHDKSVGGHALTARQRRFMGAIAGGDKPKKRRR